MVASASTAVEAKAILASLASHSDSDVATAKAKAKFTALSYVGADLLTAVAQGFEPTAYAAAVGALKVDAVKAEAKAASGDPAVAIVA